MLVICILVVCCVSVVCCLSVSHLCVSVLCVSYLPGGCLCAGVTICVLFVGLSHELRPHQIIKFPSAPPRMLSVRCTSSPTLVQVSRAR